MMTAACRGGATTGAGGAEQGPTMADPQASPMLGTAGPTAPAGDAAAARADPHAVVLTVPPAAWWDALPMLPWIDESKAGASGGGLNGTLASLNHLPADGGTLGYRTTRKRIQIRGPTYGAGYGPGVVGDAGASRDSLTRPEAGQDVLETASLPDLAAAPRPLGSLREDGKRLHGRILSEGASPLTPTLPDADAGGPLFVYHPGMVNIMRRPLRIFRLDHTYSAVAVAAHETAVELLTRCLNKLFPGTPRDKLVAFTLYEVECSTCARRELAPDELPLAVVMGWDVDIRAQMRLYCIPRIAKPATPTFTLFTARERMESRLLRRLSYRLAVQLPDRKIVMLSAQPQTTEHDVVMAVLNMTTIGGRHGKFNPHAWLLWASEPKRPPQLVPPNALLLDVLLGWPSWREGAEDAFLLIRKRVQLPDEARATTCGLPSSEVPLQVPER